MDSHQHSRHQEEHHPATEQDGEAMAELLDLDGEVLHSYLAELTAWIHGLAGDQPPRRILDLGAGTGTGTIALLERFDRADVIALDISTPFLDRLRDKARHLGMAERVHTIRADLNAPWPDIDPVDLAWASSSLHHMEDPDHALSQLFGTLRPGGLLVVAEMDSFPRFLPDDLGLGPPGLEARIHAAVADMHATEVPHRGSDWGLRLAKAGFIVEAEQLFSIDLTPPLPASTGRYAQASLRRMGAHLGGLVSAEDLATLETIVESDGPNGVLQRDDLTVRATRTVWAARCPSND